jgi:GT2 family glycosyltransferase
MEFVKSVQENCEKGTYEFIFIDNGSLDSTLNFLRNVPDSEVIANKKNLYVNPAWNQGFHRFLQKNIPYCCLCNNDVIVGKNWLDPIFEAFQKRKSEMYVPCSNMAPKKEFNDIKEFGSYHSKIENKNPIYYPLVLEFPGWCLFMKREHVKKFYPIPESIKVLRGDDWIIDLLYHEGIVPTASSHCYAYHHESKTQRSMGLGHIHQEDINEWEFIKNNYYKKYKIQRLNLRKSKVRML